MRASNLLICQIVIDICLGAPWAPLPVRSDTIRNLIKVGAKDAYHGRRWQVHVASVFLLAQYLPSCI